MGGPRRRVLTGAIIAALLLGGGSTAAWAYWTATASVPGVTLHTATLDLRFDGGNAAGVDAGYAKALSLPQTPLAPGESQAFQLSVENAATTAIEYTVNGRSDVAGVMAVALFTGAPSNATSTSPYTGSCSGGALGTRLLLTPTGQPATAAVRSLAPGSAEQLCVVVSVQAAAPASAANSTQRPTLDFIAVQGAR